MKELREILLRGETYLSVVGLGYVGLPIAAAFSERVKVIGFDLNEDKIARYRRGEDPTKEVGDSAVEKCSVEFTADEQQLRRARFHIVAVPTPVNSDHTPDLSPLRSASAILGRNLVPGSVVVFESTVYPGATEEVCVPILEKGSGLRCGVDFKVGYSPERINPGDKLHRLDTIVKIVSGMDPETLELVADVYSLVAKAGVYRAESIRVAEAAKVIENSQRDLNIAFMNELAIIFGRMGLDTQSVLRAAETKWNFIPFRPGLVGGHCIGVDPYYLTYKAEQLGYHSQVILAGRRINDDMGRYIAQELVKKLIAADRPVKNARVAVLGITFKEDCPDCRNTKVVDMLRELGTYGIRPAVADPQADPEEVRRVYGLDLVDPKGLRDMDAVVLAVAHREYRDLAPQELAEFYRPDDDRSKVMLDVKGVLDRARFEREGYLYWRL